MSKPTGRPLDALRAANPLPRERQWQLERELRDRGTDERIRAAIADDAARERASEGQRRPRVARRRVALLLGLVTMAALAVAPALGLHQPVLEFLRADKAPPAVEREFAELSIGAPSGMDPRVIAEETRKVTSVRLADGRMHTLWVAPSRRGGFCFLWSGLGGGCDQQGTVPVGATWEAGPVLTPVGVPPRRAAHQFTRILGHADADYADRVELHFQDGDIVRPHVIWVSAPINAGFFAYEPPPAKRRPGHALEKIIALDQDDDVVAQETSPALAKAPTWPPPEAITSQKRAAAEVDTLSGKATVWVAPTRTEGRCAWLEVEGHAIGFMPCKAKGVWDEGFAVRLAPTRDTVLVAGVINQPITTVTVRFADGDKAEIAPTDGFVLYEISAAHLLTGHQLTRLIGTDNTGTAHAMLRFPPDLSAQAPCHGPLRLVGDPSPERCYGDNPPIPRPPARVAQAGTREPPPELLPLPRERPQQTAKAGGATVAVYRSGLVAVHFPSTHTPAYRALRRVTPASGQRRPDLECLRAGKPQGRCVTRDNGERRVTLECLRVSQRANRWHAVGGSSAEPLARNLRAVFNGRHGLAKPPFDLCSVTGREGRRWNDGNGTRDPLEVAFNDSGRRYLAQRATARDLAEFVRSRRIHELRNALKNGEKAPTADEIVRRFPSRVLALTQASQLPPAGQIGVWSDGQGAVTLSARTPSGNRLYVELQTGRTLRSNIEPLAGVR